MRVVILGCGRVGAYLAKMLVAEGYQVAMIDQNRVAFARLGPDFPGALVVGTGIDEDVLRKAGIEQADAFVAVTYSDNTNIMATQVVKEIFDVSNVVCQIYDPLLEEIYCSLGLGTVCPTILRAAKIKEALDR
jgi:trk system potassium uptake protein TrkA